MPEPRGHGLRRVICILAYDGLCTFGIRHCGRESLACRARNSRRGTHAWSWRESPAPCAPRAGLRSRRSMIRQLPETADLVVIPGWRGADQPVPAAPCEAIRRARAGGRTHCHESARASSSPPPAASSTDGGRRPHWRYLEILGGRRIPRFTIDGAVLLCG